ncbi:MAG: hypothetical protein ABW277_22795 [Longimicrobiaceae bacterium]
MAEDNTLQNQQDEEISVEELDEVSGGAVNNGCNFVAGCGASLPDADSGGGVM